MLKTLLVPTLLLLTVSCSTVREVNQETAEISSGASMIENSADNIDRAIATGERLKERIKKPRP